jgi:hypothetical protein
MRETGGCRRRRTYRTTSILTESGGGWGHLGLKPRLLRLPRCGTASRRLGAGRRVGKGVHAALLVADNTTPPGSSALTTMRVARWLTSTAAKIPIWLRAEGSLARLEPHRYYGDWRLPSGRRPSAGSGSTQAICWWGAAMASPKRIAARRNSENRARSRNLVVGQFRFGGRAILPRGPLWGRLSARAGRGGPSPGSETWSRRKGSGSAGQAAGPTHQSE